MAQPPLPTGISMDPTEEATARSHILALLHRYASLARGYGDHYAEFEKLFETNGVIKFPDGRQMAPSQLAEVTRDNGPKYLRHNLTTVDVQFVSPEEAHSQAYVIVITDRCAPPDHWGQWNDIVKKQPDGRWLFKEKAVLVGGMNPDGWLASVSPKGFEG
jgi:hypothetical protein